MDFLTLPILHFSNIKKGNNDKIAFSTVRLSQTKYFWNINLKLTLWQDVIFLGIKKSSPSTTLSEINETKAHSFSKQFKQAVLFSKCISEQKTLCSSIATKKS